MSTFIDTLAGKFKKMDRNMVLAGIAVIAIIIVAVLIFAHSGGGFSIPSIFGKSNSQIGADVVKYINDNQLSQTPASLVSVSEKEGLVDVKIKIGTQNYDSYATKDGKLFFPQGLEMTPAKTAAAKTNSAAPTPATTAVQKTAKPLLEAFVVSSCPYGLQMQRAVADAVKNAPALAADVKIEYIGNVNSSGKTIDSMHGPEEGAENLRQICIREEQPAKYYNYISCYMQKTTATATSGMPLGDSPSCQTSTGVDKAKLSACVADPSRGLAFAQKDFTLAEKYNVQGSPTLILNGAPVDETTYGGRSSDGVKSMACAGATTAPSFCSTKLNTAAASVSFNTSYASGSAGSSANTNCATPQ